MKSIIVSITLLFSGLNALASNGVIVTRVTINEYSNHNASHAEKLCKNSAASALRSVEVQLANGSFTETLRGDAEYACKQVFFEGRSTGSDPRRRHDEYSYHRNAYVTVSCAPRTIDEKQIISFSRRCEQEPVAECYTKEFLDRAKKVQPTKYVYKFSGSCAP